MNTNIEKLISETIDAFFIKEFLGPSSNIENDQTTPSVLPIGGEEKYNKQEPGGVMSAVNIEEIQGRISSIDEDSFRIYNESLCPLLWDEYKHLEPRVRVNLLRMAYDFYDKTDFQSPIKDIYLMGSAANYNWTPDSDADVHVIIDFNELKMPIETAMKAAKVAGASWNNEHQVWAKGHKVEINIQNSNELKPHVTGIYSLVNDQWVRTPSHQNLEINKVLIQQKYSAVKDYIVSIIQSGNYELMKQAKKYLDAFRQYGLDSAGELSVENIVFKILRARGFIKNLKDALTARYDKEMTVTEDMPWKDDNVEFESKTQTKDAIVKKLIPHLNDDVLVVTVNKIPEIPQANYVQIDYVYDGINYFSSNPESMSRLGYDMPSTREFLELPSGKYKISDVKKKLRLNESDEEDIISGDLEQKDYDQANQLIKQSGINILRNKELVDVIKRDGNVIAGLWTEDLDDKWSNGNDTVTLRDILFATENIPVKEIDTDRLAKIVLRWNDPKENEKIEGSNLEYPVLIIVDNNNNIKYILDGNHRVHKAISHKLPTVKVKLIKLSMLPTKMQKILCEVNQSDIKQKHPGVAAIHKNYVKLNMMTLDNLKSMKAKESRMLRSYSLNPEGNAAAIQWAIQQYRMYDLEIKRRLAYINKPINESHDPEYNVAVDFMERRDQQLYELGNLLKASHGKGHLPWKTISASLLKKTWLLFGKYKKINENAIDKIADQILTNIARLAATTAMMGHTMGNTREEMKDNGMEFTDEEWDDWMSTYFTDKHGNWRLSDYGLEPLQNIYGKIFNADTPEEKLYACDKALNVVHQRSDLAEMFVEGGSKTLTDVANQGGYNAGGEYGDVNREFREGVEEENSENDIIVGVVDINCQVKAHRNYSHSTLMNFGEDIKRWRYKLGTTYVFWWETPNEWDKEAVDEYLKDDYDVNVSLRHVNFHDYSQQLRRDMHDDTKKLPSSFYDKNEPSVAEGVGAGIPEQDRLHIPGHRWQIKSKDAPKTPKMKEGEDKFINELVEQLLTESPS